MSATSYIPPSEYPDPTDSIVPDEDEAHSGQPGIGVQPHRVLGNNEVKGVVQREIEDSLGGLGSQVSEQQRMALRYYYGRALGNEIPDRSQVVSLDVLEVVEWTMPSLMRMFTGGAQIVAFGARNPEEQDNCDTATKVMNALWEHKLNGFRFLYDLYKTGLLEKNWFAKVYWEETRKPVVESYKGIDESEMLSILDGEDEEEIEPISHEEYQKTIKGVEVVCHDLTIRRWKIEKGLKLDAIPPEEFLIARRAIHLNDDTPFSAQRKKMTVSELVSMGFDYDELSRVPSDDMPEYTQGRTERLSEDETYPVTTAERTDAASREIWVTDCYIKIDEDGDGYAELRRILIVGEHATTILEDEEISMNPFVSATPVPMPHKFYGQSLADLTQDLQMIRSTILRQMLDHIYLSNNPRLSVVDGMVEVEDLLTVRPGGIVRQRAPGQIEPLVLPPLPPEAMQLLQYLEDVRANRTGIMAHGRELDASAINSTATGLAQLMAEKQQKIELIARIYGNGLKEIFRKCLKLMVENDSKEQQVEIAGEWVTFNPKDWNPEWDVTIEVGLGAGQAIERIQNLEKIMQVQAQHVSNGGLNYTVTPKNLYESASRMAEAAGYRNKALFFQDPSNEEPPQPKPDADLEKVKVEMQKAQMDSEARKAEFQLASRKEENIVRHRAQELSAQSMLKQADIEMRERMGIGQQQATIEAARISASAGDEAGEENENE